MKRQVPRFVSLLLIALTVAAVFWIVGANTPTDERAMTFAAPGPSAVTGPAPDISGPTTAGDTFRLADHKGKVVLVNFWATWCGPCRMEMPDLVALQKRFGPRGFTVVGVSTDDGVPLDRLRTFVTEAGLNYPVLLAPAGAQANYGGVPALPTSFLIDRQGNVVSGLEGATNEAALAPEIEKLLGADS